MKIGEFASYFHVKKSTIRYYTEIKLLFPDTSSTYPEYHDVCINDMTNILDLRDMGFSIDEIQTIKARERLLLHHSGDDNSINQKFFTDKIKDHQSTIETLKSKIDKIEAYTCEPSPNTASKSIGLPFRGLDYFQCYKCQSKFSITDAIIIGQSIRSGRMSCSCGNAYLIHDGIVIPDLTPGEIDIIKNQNYGHANLVTNNLIAMIKKCGQVTKPIIKSWDHTKGIIFTNSDIDIFLMELNDLFVDHGLYFFCSYDYKSLIELKKVFESKGLQGDFVFLYYTDHVPLAKGIPYLIDDIGNLYDLLVHEPLGYGIEKFSHLGMIDSEWFCFHLGCVTGTSSENLENAHYYNMNDYLKFYKPAHMVLVQQEILGESQEFDLFINGTKKMDTLLLSKLYFRYDDL